MGAAMAALVSERAGEIKARPPLSRAPDAG